MAIYHLTVKTGAKGYGGSHADYIARDGKYSNREDCQFTESGNMPEWASSAHQFWQAADEHERANGRSYREIEFALPRELNDEQRVELAREYVRNIVGERHAYTFAIHAPVGKDGEQNPHVHFMFTERTNDGIDRDAAQFFSRYNSQDPSKGGAKKDRSLNSRYFVSAARKEWTATANHYLAKENLACRIDDRSYQERGINLESQNTPRVSLVGDRATIRQWQFKVSEELKERQATNGANIIADPKVALAALTSNESAFTKRDLEKFIFNHTDGAEQYTAAYNAVIFSPEFQKLAGTDKYTTREMFAIESDIRDRVRSSNDKPIEAQTETQRQHQHLVETSRTFNDEQKAAFNCLTSNAEIVSVNGAAGTGKSYVLSAVNEYYKSENKDVYGVALQGITAQSMENDAGIKSSTIAGFLHQVEKGKIKLNSNSVIVLDEAGMVGSRDMQKLLQLSQDNGAVFRMVGDSKQLSAVSAGNSFASVQAELSTANQVSLVQIMRQKDENMRAASIDLSKHNVSDALDKYAELGKVKEFDTQDAARDETVEKWYTSKSDSKIMLAYTNKDVDALNNKARDLLRADGKLANEEYTAPTYKGSKQFSVNDQIIFKQNNRDLGVLNGTRATIESISADEGGAMQSFTAKTADGKLVTIKPDEYDKFNHNYATTIHGSQGLTVNEAHVLASKNMNANLAYVAMTRHKQDIQFNYSKEEFSGGLSEVKAQLGKQDNKEFTGDKTLDSSFDSLRAEFSIEQRETFAEQSAKREAEHTPAPTEKAAQVTVEKQETATQDTQTLGADLSAQAQPEAPGVANTEQAQPEAQPATEQPTQPATQAQPVAEQPQEAKPVSLREIAERARTKQAPQGETSSERKGMSFEDFAARARAKQAQPATEQPQEAKPVSLREIAERARTKQAPQGETSSERKGMSFEDFAARARAKQAQPATEQPQEAKPVSLREIAERARTKQAPQQPVAEQPTQPATQAQPAAEKPQEAEHTQKAEQPTIEQPTQAAQAQPATEQQPEKALTTQERLALKRAEREAKERQAQPATEQAQPATEQQPEKTLTMQERLALKRAEREAKEQQAQPATEQQPEKALTMQERLALKRAEREAKEQQAQPATEQQPEKASTTQERLAQKQVERSEQRAEQGGQNEQAQAAHAQQINERAAEIQKYRAERIAEQRANDNQMEH